MPSRNKCKMTTFSTNFGHWNGAVATVTSLGMCAFWIGSRFLEASRWSIALPVLAMLSATSPSSAQAPCEPPAARVASIQGTVELKRAGTDVWAPVMLDEALCIGDALRVGQASRAALALANDSTLRLDQHTTLLLRGVAEEGLSLLDLLLGVVYFFSHQPRALAVDTPFVNAAAEGTEFLVRVADDRAEVIMLDGQVLLQNPQGELRIASGQAAMIPAGAAPAPMVVVDPEILPKLTAEDLLAIGVGSVGHRRKLRGDRGAAKLPATGSEYITMISNGCHWLEAALRNLASARLE